MNNAMAREIQHRDEYETVHKTNFKQAVSKLIELCSVCSSSQR